MTDHASNEWAYVQPEEILDLAWDRYMELSVHEGPDGAPGMVRLATLRMDPPVISRLFDIAITAYREAAEQGSR